MNWTDMTREQLWKYMLDNFEARGIASEEQAQKLETDFGLEGVNYQDVDSRQNELRLYHKLHGTGDYQIN